MKNEIQHSLRGQVWIMQLAKKHLLSTLKNYFISVVVEDVLYTEVHSQFLVLNGGEGLDDLSNHIIVPELNLDVK